MSEQNVERKAIFAQVVVNIPIRQRGARNPSASDPRTPLSRWETAFHYSVPPHLRASVAIGQLVVVPFASTERQGIIISFSDVAPVAEVREILSISDPQPVLSFSQIELARWISRNYLAPLPLSVNLMLPSGLARRLQTNLKLGGKSPDSKLSQDEQVVLDMIRRKGHIPLAAVKQLFGDQQGQRLVNHLAHHGFIIKDYRLGESRVRPKTDRLVGLLADDPAIERKRLHIGRSSKQADILCLLLESDVAGMEPSYMMEQVGCKEGPLNALKARGLIYPEAPIRLNVTAEEAFAEVIRLRRSEKHLAVLDLLRSEEGPVWVGWVYAQTGADLKAIQDLQEHALIRLDEAEVFRNPLEGKVFSHQSAPELTPAQQTVLQIICRSLAERSGARFLLHGITGSGKTEIYLRALEIILARGQGGIVLVPEIALTPQTIERFASRFPGKVAVQHSALSLGERYDQWRQIRARRFPIVVGTRSALFAPIPNLGLIVIDEEHDTSYKQDITPRYHAREAATKLAEITGATLILGSATPDVISYTRAKRGDYTLLELPHRIITPSRAKAPNALRDELTPGMIPSASANGLPSVEVVDMREELKSGNRSIFCGALTAAIEHALQRGEQVILFLNRRGTSTFVLCRDCGAVMKCSHCDVPLAYHARAQSLQCHHCNRQSKVPTRCPHCGSNRIKFFGIGTEKVATLTAEAFPEARILRWDRDATRSKGAHEAIMNQFVRREADILVGTQMIAKGLDLPLVTVVGIISADTALYLPDFRTAERTFQLLTQVAGRAGRSDLGGRVYIQTYTPEHYAIRAASRHDYSTFYKEEMAFRRSHSYPPYSRLARLLYSHYNQDRCRQQAEKLYQNLKTRIAQLGLTEISIIGPAPCFLERIKDRYRWQLVLRARDPRALLEEMPALPDWEIDIDPIHLL